MTKIAVVTASVGANDIIEPPVVFEGVDYFAFVDKSKVDISGSWTRKQHVEFSSDPYYNNRRNAKRLPNARQTLETINGLCVQKIKKIELFRHKFFKLTILQLEKAYPY